MQFFAGQPTRLTFARAGRALAVALGALLAMASHAYAGGTDQLKQFVSQVHAARGSFVQRELKAPSNAKSTSDAVATATLNAKTSSGTFVFSRPGKFIWNYEKPYQQQLQSDGDNLYVYDKDLNQVTERKLGGALGASPAAILFGSNDLDKNFTLSDAGVKNGIDWLELIPKSKDTQFKSVGIGFRDGNLEAMELHDVFGNVTLLTFSNIEKNPSLPASTFKFVRPKGADLITGGGN
ncbi:outer membrane lipoprotein chaperone LolA [Paraburkholderia tropica]|uniref:outer membrane lipoprotein chaperone LolA n=1 Tax=Paraburkholderia tropica TaxID=92647 RepID=UPI002AB621B7|nr:outer membrane lipoprotein chaperone LolA [Paraburkholderia tropica]